jgi:hypothetical protein
MSQCQRSAYDERGTDQGKDYLVRLHLVDAVRRTDDDGDGHDSDDYDYEPYDNGVENVRRLTGFNARLSPSEQRRKLEVG